MIILGIETSCDETAISVIEVTEGSEPSFHVLGNALISQTKIHEQYGGVFPIMAKREHAKNAVPLLHKALQEAKLLKEKIKTEQGEENEGQEKNALTEKQKEHIEKILEKESGLYEHLITFLQKIHKPDVTVIAVTSGPGLEPALWVGLSFAKALSVAWDIPVVPVNHMEGHIIASLFTAASKLLKKLELPALALLISGGHTELVLMQAWRKYEILGRTRDDAVGEAFDKVARLLGLPYPGGPQISELAEKERVVLKMPASAAGAKKEKSAFALPRPMINSDDFDFSFSGLKTAVLYLLKGQNEKGKNALELNEEIKRKIALECENAIAETLVAKTEKAIEKYSPRALVVGGGVIANKHIRKSFEELAEKWNIPLHLPHANLATDNAFMIALAGYFVYKTGKISDIAELKAEGNLSL